MASSSRMSSSSAGNRGPLAADARRRRPSARTTARSASRRRSSSRNCAGAKKSCTRSNDTPLPFNVTAAMSKRPRVGGRRVAELGDVQLERYHRLLHRQPTERVQRESASRLSAVAERDHRPRSASASWPPQLRGSLRAATSCVGDVHRRQARPAARRRSASCRTAPRRRTRRSRTSPCPGCAAAAGRTARLRRTP